MAQTTSKNIIKVRQTDPSELVLKAGSTMEGTLKMPYQPYWYGNINAGTGTNFYQNFTTLASYNITITTNNTLNINTAGLYAIGFHQLLSTGGSGNFTVQVNGSTVQSAYTPGAVSARDFDVHIIRNLSVGDTIKLYCNFNVTKAWSGGHSYGYCYMIG